MITFSQASQEQSWENKENQSQRETPPQCAYYPKAKTPRISSSSKRFNMNVRGKVNKFTANMLEELIANPNFQHFSEKYEYSSVTTNGRVEDKDEESVLGRGAHGVVYRVVDKKEQKPYAMKMVAIRSEEDYSDTCSNEISANDEDNILEFIKCCQEACLLSKFHHPNIVKAHDTWIQMSDEESGEDDDAVSSAADASTNIQRILDFLQEARSPNKKPMKIPQEVADALVKIQGLTLYMVMDLYEKDLEKWLDIEANRTKQIAKIEIIKGLIKALYYLHGKNYCHLDLKPANILVKGAGDNIKTVITDFGLCTLYRPKTINREPLAGTFSYNTAPDKNVSDKLDIWSFGLIVYYVIASGTTSSELIHLLNERNDTGDVNTAKHLPKDVLPKFQSIVPRCLKRDQFKRVSAKTLNRELIEADFPTAVLELSSNEDSESEEDDVVYYTATDGEVTDDRHVSSSHDNDSELQTAHENLCSSDDEPETFTYE